MILRNSVFLEIIIKCHLKNGTHKIIIGISEVYICQEEKAQEERS